MENIADINFTVTVHFANGISLEREIPLKKAYKLSSKPNAIIPPDSDIIEIVGQNSTVIIPLNIVFVVSESVDFKHINKISRYLLYKRDGGCCGYCGKHLSLKESTIDHIIPKKLNGKNTWENIVLACHRCNTLKDDKTLEESGLRLRITPYNPKKGKRRQEE